MDPNNSQSQGDNTNLAKLEDDLKKLSQEAGQTSTPSPSSTAIHETLPVAATNPPAQPAVPTDTPQQTIPPIVPPTAPTKKKSSLMVVAVVLVAIALLAVVAYVVGAQFFSQNSASSPTPQACTEEAKICPDGSSVGRTGPNCEFAACPAATAAPTETPADSTPSGSPLTSPTVSPTSSPSASPTTY